MDALPFLQSVAGYAAAQNDGAASKPVLLGTIDPAYGGLPNLPKVTFDGESTLSGRTYAHIASYVPVAGDRVALVPVGTTYLIVGPIAATAAAVNLQGGTATVAGLLTAGSASVTGAATVGSLVVPGGQNLDVGTWQTYTPAWTASTTNPTIGNAVMSGRYIYLNKHTVMASIRIAPGGTTAKGTGNYQFSLPVTAASAVFGNIGVFAINDSGAALRAGSVVMTNTGAVELWMNASGGPVASTTLTGTLSSTHISITITYEV